MYYEQLLNLRESQMNESQRNMFVILKLRQERVADQEKTDKEL